MAIKGEHPELDARASTDPVLEKVLHDYPILLRRIQSAQETIAKLKLDSKYTKLEIKEIEDLEKHIDEEVVKKECSDGLQIKERA